MPRQNLGRVKGDKGDSFTFDDFTSEQLDGITPKMLLGNVTTLEPDENAAVSMRKEGLKNYVDFSIPRGKNGAEIKNISAENVEMADKTTLESTMATVNESVDTNNAEINKIKSPAFDDTVSTYTALNSANTAAETASNAIKSKVSIFTTLSNIKKSFSAIVQGLKILATNVGMIQGITSDLNSESDYIAASSKALATLNGNLIEFSSASLEVNQACAIESYANHGMCFRYGNLVIVHAILGGMHFFSQTHLFLVPPEYRPHTNAAGNIMCRRYSASVNTPLFGFPILVASDGRIAQQFNSDGESTIWEGEIFAAYTV